MTREHCRWAAALGVALALPAVAWSADPWWVVKPHPAPAAPAAHAPSSPAATLGRPIARPSIDPPVPVAAPAAPAASSWGAPTTGATPAWNTPTVPDAPAVQVAMPAGYDETPGAFPPPRVARGQPPDPAPPGTLSGPPPIPPTGDGAYNAGADASQPLHRPFLAGCGEWFNFGAPPSNTDGGWFKSDCLCEDSMISPVTNPFFFTDPRALTEIRPLFIIQKAPKANGGGNDEFFGVQGSLALSDRFSLVLNKLGFVSLNPSEPVGDIYKGTGFADVYLGPKYTFWRDESARSAAAVGLTLELPVGSSHEFQDTGTLGLDPYISYSKGFGDSSCGSFNFVGELGYSFAVDDKRTEFFHASAHLDYDVLRMHRFYPLLELNWFHDTRRGDNVDLPFEGADLVNFGSREATDRDLVTIAPGFRYKFSEWANVGTAVEFPLTSGKALQDVRWTVDLIFRY